MKQAVVGTGTHVYEVTRPFDDMAKGDVSHVGTDSVGQVYIYRRDNPSILIFDKDDRFARAWSPDVVWAHGLYITADDELFFGDGGAHVVRKFNAAGELTLQLGNLGRPSWQAPFNTPTDIAVAPSGEILVADGYGNSSVHKFAPDGELVMSWGGPGTAPGEFANPHAVWVDADYRVYVVDQYNHRVQIFDENGRFLTEWKGFYVPMDIFIDQDGFVFVSDYIPRITVLDRAGTIMSRGKSPISAHGIWGDIDGNLYCAGNREGVVKLVRL